MPTEPAHSLALRWLAQKSLSVGEIKERLTQKQQDPLAIADVVEQLLQVGLLDDGRLAQQIVAKGLERHEGPKRLAVRLARRRIAPEVCRDLINDLQSHVDWLRIAEPLLERYDISSQKERTRLVRRLVQEGFPGAVVYRLAGERGEDIRGVDDY